MMCDKCGLTYDRFRTGLTYADIQDQFWRPEEEPSKWVNKSRHTYLGRWHEIKLKMWEQHIAECRGGTDENIIESIDYNIDGY